MRPWWERYKPAASVRTHLLLATATWMLVGLMLTARGAAWVAGDPIPYWPAWIALAIIGGVLKARYVLSRVAERAVKRIQERGDGRCVGGFFAVKSWLLVIVMIAGGRLARETILPSHGVGLLYTLVGVALLLGSIKLWRLSARRETA